MSSRTEYSHQYYLKNKAKILARQKARLRANPEKRKQYERQWYLMNKDRITARQRQYRKTERFKILHKKQGSEWYQKNKEYKDQQNRLWRRENPERWRLFMKHRRARELGAEGTHTLEEWNSLRSLYNYTCPKCFRREPEVILTQDHKIPLSKGGTNAIDNIQPLCKSCNSAKKDKTWFASYPINYKQNVNAAVFA